MNVCAALTPWSGKLAAGMSNLRIRRLPLHQSPSSPFFFPLAPLSTRSSWADDGCQFQLPVWLARAAPSNCWRNRRASRKQVSTKEWHDEPSICEQCVQTLHILIIISSSCTASCTGVHTCFLVAPNQLA